MVRVAKCQLQPAYFAVSDRQAALFDCGKRLECEEIDDLATLITSEKITSEKCKTGDDWRGGSNKRLFPSHRSLNHLLNFIQTERLGHVSECAQRE